MNNNILKSMFIMSMCCIYAPNQNFSVSMKTLSANDRLQMEVTLLYSRAERIQMLELCIFNYFSDSLKNQELSENAKGVAACYMTPVFFPIDWVNLEDCIQSKAKYSNYSIGVENLIFLSSELLSIVLQKVRAHEKFRYFSELYANMKHCLLFVLNNVSDLKLVNLTTSTGKEIERQESYQRIRLNYYLYIDSIYKEISNSDEYKKVQAAFNSFVESLFQLNDEFKILNAGNLLQDIHSQLRQDNLECLIINILFYCLQQEPLKDKSPGRFIKTFNISMLSIVGEEAIDQMFHYAMSNNCGVLDIDSIEISKENDQVSSRGRVLGREVVS